MLWEYPKVCVNLQTDVSRLTSLEVYFMARKKDTPQKAALREMMGNYKKTPEPRASGTGVFRGEKIMSYG